MKKILLAALLAGATAVATPAAALPTQTTPTAQPSASPSPVSKVELKRRRKLRTQNGPVVYKGRIAEESEFLTDDDGNGKDGTKSAKSKRKKARAKQ